MIVCLRTALVPPEWRALHAWIDGGREIRQQHGILAELVCEPGGYLNLPAVTVHHPNPPTEENTP